MKQTSRNAAPASLLPVLLLLSLCIPHNLAQPTTQNQTATPTSSSGCNYDLIQSYSLSGKKIPSIDKIEMCPSIVRSCCQQTDQQIIYANFIHGGEYQSVVDHYMRVSGIYSNLIEKLTEVQDFAKSVKNNIVKKVANCKLLAERILNYEVSQVQDQVRQNLAKMQEFFQVAYSGFYCTICNFDNQKYFDTPTQTIYYSEKFCRDIVENTLPVQLLFHVDIVKHANLVTKFVSSCDFTGTYNLDAVVPSNYTFAVVNDDMQDLQACRDNRNKREWFSYCKDICVEFKIASFSNFFQPNLQLISSYTNYLTTTLNTLTAAQSSRPLFGALSTPTGSSNKRILAADDGKCKHIFKPSISGKVDLTTWQTEFLLIGISLHDEGTNSLINEQTYSSVKVFLQLLNSQAQQPAKSPAPPTTATTTGTRSARKLKSSTLVSALAGLLVVCLTWFQ